MSRSAPDGKRRPVFAVVKDTFVATGRPRVRVTRSLPDGLSDETALSVTRSMARNDLTRRYRLLKTEPYETEPRLVWDSHPAS
jgi:hypothetical protein